MDRATNGHEDDADDLDRALFALPLAEPPAGLRADILRATIYAPVAPSAAFGRGETVAIGVVLALAVWVSIAFVTDRALAVGFEEFAVDAVRSLAETQTVLWLGFGAAVALFLTRFGVPTLGGLSRRNRTSA